MGPGAVSGPQFSPMTEEEKAAIDRQGVIMRRHTRALRRISLGLMASGFGSVGLYGLLGWGWPSTTLLVLATTFLALGVPYMFDEHWHPELKAGNRAWREVCARNGTPPPWPMPGDKR